MQFSTYHSQHAFGPHTGAGHTSAPHTSFSRFFLKSLPLSFLTLNEVSGKNVINVLARSCGHKFQNVSSLLE